MASMNSSSRALSASVSILGTLFLLSWSMAVRDMINAGRLRSDEVVWAGRRASSMFCMGGGCSLAALRCIGVRRRRTLLGF